MSDDEIRVLSAAFEHAAAEHVIEWAVHRFGLGRICVAASMGDTVLAHLAAAVAPGIEVVFCDTGYHFPETLETAVQLSTRSQITLRTLSPAADAVADLWRTDTDACCAQRKVEPLDRHLADRDAWLSGLRRTDSPGRAATPILSRDRRGLVKVNPIATWSDEQVAHYIAAHDVVVNPLLADGYASIGCWPCTARSNGGDARAGRWVGSQKTECGLHLD
jgi:phosphoadenosine phosphosulfate reductase